MSLAPHVESEFEILKGFNFITTIETGGSKEYESAP
jgi:hypothetical protein